MHRFVLGDKLVLEPRREPKDEVDHFKHDESDLCLIRRQSNNFNIPLSCAKGMQGTTSLPVALLVLTQALASAHHVSAIGDVAITPLQL